MACTLSVVNSRTLPPYSDSCPHSAVRLCSVAARSPSCIAAFKTSPARLRTNTETMLDGSRKARAALRKTADGFPGYGGNELHQTNGRGTSLRIGGIAVFLRNPLRNSSIPRGTLREIQRWYGRIRQRDVKPTSRQAHRDGAGTAPTCGTEQRSFISCRRTRGAR